MTALRIILEAGRLLARLLPVAIVAAIVALLNGDKRR